MRLQRRSLDHPACRARGSSMVSQPVFSRPLIWASREPWRASILAVRSSRSLAIASVLWRAVRVVRTRTGDLASARIRSDRSRDPVAASTEAFAVRRTASSPADKAKLRQPVLTRTRLPYRYREVYIAYCMRLNVPLRYHAANLIGKTMTEPLFQLLDAVNIDNDRQYIEFQFKDYEDERRVIQIDFDYLESLLGVLRQAFISAVLAGEQRSNRILGEEWVSVLR